MPKDWGMELINAPLLEEPGGPLAVMLLAHRLEARRGLVRDADLLDRIAGHMGENHEVDEIVRVLVEELGSLAPVAEARLILLGPDGAFHEVFATGASAEGPTLLEVCGGDHDLLATLREERVLILEPDDCTQRPGVLFGVHAGDDFVGVLGLWTTRGHSLLPHRELLVRIGLQFSLAVGNARLYEEMRALHVNTLKGLGTALSAKDYYTLGHAARVSTYAVLLLQELGWDPRRLGECADAAFLHDIGKIGVSDRILLKQGPLNTEEWELMRQHPVVSADIVRPLFAEEVVAAVRHHHERFGGGGYPDGLVGSDIPLLARVFAVVDAYDAMSLNRPYRMFLSYPECVAELERCRGSQFDPEIVTAFLRVLSRLRRRQEWAQGVAGEAASRVDVEKHKLLTEPGDQARPEYREIADVLRALRLENPPIRFIYTQAFGGRDKAVFVVDAEEDGSPDKNNLGDEFFLDHNLQCILTGRHVDSLVFFADEFGVWLTTAVPLCDRNGVIVAAVAVDVPALDGVEIPGHLVRGPSRVVDAATVRLTRAEIDSITDGLTGLYNHRYIHERLAEELARASREHTELSLLFCDLDNFKQFNDRFGHSAGDRALRTVAGIILGCVRSIDLVGRYGGEEFTVVLPEIDSRGTLEVAERIRAAVESTHELSEGGALTVSIGVARYPTDAANKEELVDRADWSMYRAKRAGRNQVVPFVVSVTDQV